MIFQVQTNLPDDRNVVADNQEAALEALQATLKEALENGSAAFTVRSAERGGKGFWTKGESIVIDYFGRTNGNGDPMSGIYEPSRVYP